MLGNWLHCATCGRSALLFAAVVGRMYLGWFSPTRAAGRIRVDPCLCRDGDQIEHGAEHAWQVAALDIDPIWFGILLVTVVEIGLITPPIGMNLFVLRAVADDLPLQTIIRGILPFILADIARLAILIAIPSISLWLPSFMMT